MSQDRVEESRQSKMTAAQPPAAIAYGGKSSGSLKYYAQAKKSQIGGAGNGQRNLNNGIDITTKVYPSDVIPDRKALE